MEKKFVNSILMIIITVSICACSNKSEELSDNGQEQPIEKNITIGEDKAINIISNNSVVTLTTEESQQKIVSESDNENVIDREQHESNKTDFNSELSLIVDDIIKTLNDFGYKVEKKDIDFNKAVKIYVDTNIFKLETNNIKDIVKFLEDNTYIYELPLFIDGSTIILNISKGLPLNDDVSFTEEEKLTILNNVGKWGITAFYTYENETVDYFSTIKQFDNTMPDDIIIIGGLPFFQVPIALLPDENGEISRIVLFTKLAGINKNDILNFKLKENVYNYTQVKDFINNSGG